MLLSPSYKTIELSTLVDNKKEYKMSFMHSHNRFILHLNKSLWIKDGRGT